VSVLLAGIGNVFLGDDGFGVEVVRALARRKCPGWLRVVDFGIRGFDLAYALLEHDAAVLVDALPRGHAPGTLTVLEPLLDESEPAAAFETHSMEPGSVLRLVRALGGRAPRLRVLGCEPLELGSDEDLVLGLSEPVAAAIEPAADMALELAAALEAEVRHA
jgi:hydrogenase maturation protease